MKKMENTLVEYVFCLLTQGPGNYSTASVNIQRKKYNTR